MLNRKTILVTGAARGLGERIATALAGQGARLILADILEREGNATASRLGAEFRPVDLGDPASIEVLADEVSAITGGELDGLVNNGAIATGIGGIPFDRIEIDSWELVQRVNVRGTWLMIRAMAPLLKAGGKGRVVNMASDTAIWGAPNLMSYVASKGAIISMTRSLARELGPDGIGVTAVAPGILTTESTEYVPAERHDLYATRAAVPGPQAPEDVTGVIAFLMSDGALTLTGQVLPVNNGFVYA